MPEVDPVTSATRREEVMGTWGMEGMRGGVDPGGHVVADQYPTIVRDRRSR